MSGCRDRNPTCGRFFWLCTRQPKNAGNGAGARALSRIHAYPHYLYSPPGEDYYSADSPASASFFSSRAIFASASSSSFCSCAAVFTFVNVLATGAAPLPALAGSRGAVRGFAFAPAHLRANQPVSWVHPMILHKVLSRRWRGLAGCIDR